MEVAAPYACTGHGVDIAAGGVGIEIPLEISVGTSLEMKIFDGHLIVQGSVRWVQPIGENFRIGVQFNEEDWNIIEKVNAMRKGS